MKTLLLVVGLLVFAPLSFAQEKPEAAPDRKLTEFESSLLGKWYFGGNSRKVGHMVNAGSKLFYINENTDAVEIKVVGDGILRGTHQGAQLLFIVKGDYLLCENGYWASRTPVQDFGKQSNGFAEQDAAANP